jgi:hypothetical protein
MAVSQSVSTSCRAGAPVVSSADRATRWPATEQVLRAEPTAVDPVFRAAPHPHDPATAHRDVHGVPLGVQQRRRAHPALHLVDGVTLDECWSTRIGQASPGPNGVRVPHGSAIASR